ncbi:hypothetical protein P3584_16610 [Vibrio parahaemolyticus]|uniref:Uncharacterized protein n=1 Tax=Vibrio owensii TaxID=696485 RepID=A0AAP9KDJ4_9VIBR|nr:MULTISPECIES: hypothetical protein [Vibrio harveyi group]MCZ5867349.1 hypothetical protein [Vibrio parahaemolyticus]MCZ5897916.1 hypothetical protein [Vibrio parahaemolyticus]MCZ6020212.1 hypothetical protein [Vibrio parahaemolyticus]MCZ6305898.1 hypothetical protein [Vibrio parahaemolyticus]MDF4895394.1 hypothetical protein [Vibrio parahaemolyticus]
MSIKQLRAAIAPCCGLGANRAEVDAALNNVSAQLRTQEQLLVETLNILEHSLKAIRLDAVTEELLQNHYGAIKVIREHFESAQPNELYSVKLMTQAQSLTEAEILRMIKQPGQFQPMPKVAVSQIDQVIHDLFSNNWTSDLRTAPIDKMRAQLYKNLKDQLAGYWTGHTAYWILVNGGFIVDGPKGTAKQLTRFGSMFKEEMESINDTAQETRSHLQSQALQQTASMVPVAQIEKSVEEHVAHFISLIRTIRVSDKLLPNGYWIHRTRRCPVQCWPWSADASIKSIERRIQAAIKSREFAKAQRLDSVKQALVFIESNPIELGAMA